MEKNQLEIDLGREATDLCIRLDLGAEAEKIIKMIQLSELGIWRTIMLLTKMEIH